MSPDPSPPPVVRDFSIVGELELVEPKDAGHVRNANRSNFASLAMAACPRDVNMRSRRNARQILEQRGQCPASFLGGRGKLHVFPSNTVSRCCRMHASAHARLRLRFFSPVLMWR